MLRSALDAHELAGHQLLSGAPVDRPAFLQQQQDLARRFDDAIRSLPAERGMSAAAGKARAEWQYGLAEHGVVGQPGAGRPRETGWPNPGLVGVGRRRPFPAGWDPALSPGVDGLRSGLRR